MNARETILSRLRAALSDPALRYPPPETLGLSERVEVTHQSGDRWALADRFSRELSSIYGTAEVLETETEARMAAIGRISSWLDEDLAERKTENPERPGDRDILCWDPQFLPIEGLDIALADLGFRLVVPKNLKSADERANVQQIRAGITSVDVAFATTGSILVGGAQGRSRSASLLPLRHLVLIPMSRLFPNVERWMAAHRQAGTLTSYLKEAVNVTLITGPSKSADIGGSLTLGVHGPKVVHAILFDDEAGENRV